MIEAALNQQQLLALVEKIATYSVGIAVAKWGLLWWEMRCV